MDINNKIKLLSIIMKILEYKNLNSNDAILMNCYFNHLYFDYEDDYSWIETLSNILELTMIHELRDYDNFTIHDDSPEYDDFTLRDQLLDGFIFTNMQFQHFSALYLQIQNLSKMNLINEESVTKLNEIYKRYMDPLFIECDRVCAFYGETEIFEYRQNKHVKSFELVFSEFSVSNVPLLFELNLALVKGTEALIPIYKTVLRKIAKSR